MARNLEIKVACGPQGLADVRQRLAERDLVNERRLDQVDTYFQVPSGRLKLREQATYPGEPSEQKPERSAKLIGYVRDTVAGSRWSEYHVVPVENDAVAGMMVAALAVTIGVRVTVRKRRDVVIWGSTRVHLDIVTDLGSFVELETVIGNQGEAAAEHEHAAVIEALGLNRWDPIPGSYSDLLDPADANAATGDA